MYQLTQQQFQVIDALSNGATFSDAAAQAGIHRNTIGNCRASDDFREALASAHRDRAALYHDRAVALADLAFEALRKVLTDPNSSPSVLLRAATLIIEKVTTPPKLEKEKPAGAVECTTAHNDFQMNNSAQPQESYRRPEPKIGRNEPCPCGSGKKYKQCCLNKNTSAAATA